MSMCNALGWLQGGVAGAALTAQLWLAAAAHTSFQRKMTTVQLALIATPTKSITQAQTSCSCRPPVRREARAYVESTSDTRPCQCGREALSSSSHCRQGRRRV